MFSIEMLLAVILVCCSVTLTESKGWVDPQNIFIRSGDEIRIRCGYPELKDSHRFIGFFNNSVPIDRKYIKPINSSTIELVIPNARVQESTIVCKLNDTHGIWYTDVRVGREPEIVTDVKCLSYNLQIMNCTVIKPYNPVPVNYSLKYRIEDSATMYQFERDPTQNDPKIVSFSISNSGYRKHNEKFELLLNGTNELGFQEQRIPLNNFASVVPSSPENLKEVKIASNSVTLSWNVHINLLVFPVPFDYEFVIVSPTECNPVKQRLVFANISSVDALKEPVNFSRKIDLTFANTWYDIRIRMKISLAEDREEMWSQSTRATTIQVKTLSRIPDHPPKVDAGSFNIGASGDVYIYWKHLTKCYQNGGNFTYRVSSSNILSDKPHKETWHMASYTKEQIDLSEDTLFTIRSANVNGTSRDASYLTIPGYRRRLPGPIKIRKILSGGNYHLSWSPAEQTTEEITSYTVFWCVSKSELANSCEGSIDFVSMGKSKTHYEHQSNETLNFAVSANSKSSTSGMFWALCTTANSNQIGKIKTIWIPRLAATEIEVEWKLECTDSGIVAGYQLEYCPILKPRSQNCTGNKSDKLNITGGMDKHTLTNLMPYTTYQINIRMFSNSTMGPKSENLANTTLEAAPSEVRGLIARNIGNNSVELYWDSPEFSNGVLLFYKVWANRDIHKIQKDYKVEIENAHNTRMNYTLKDLMAFTEYDIAVTACTKECSKASQTKIKTTIGTPGGFSSQPGISTYRSNLLTNYTSAEISWDEPMFKGGELDYYEFKTKFTSGEGKIIDKIIKTRSRSCYVDQLCTGDIMLYDFSVRAINYVQTPHSKETQVKIRGANEPQNCEVDDRTLLQSLDALKETDPHGWHLQGPWSPPIGHSCHFGANDSGQTLIAVFSILSVMIMFVMIYVLYKKYNDMKDILVQMPPGLEDLTGDKLKKGKDLGSHIEKPDILRNVDAASINCEDENGQLLKKSLNGSLNGGDCSSSINSESTRSEMDHMENDGIEYGELRGNGLQSFNSLGNSPILSSSPDSIPTSTPVAVKPNIILNTKIPMPSNGYVTQPPPKITSPVLPNSSGYVTHSMFSPLQSGGYTPLSAFRKPMNQSSPLDDKLNSKTPIVATTDQEGISGYVTHKQLSDFGHRMQ